MTVDTAAVSEPKKTNLAITKRDRRDVIRQVREITGLDDDSINQTIEACKDSTGRYSLEQVISLLFDDNLRNNLQRSPSQPIPNHHPSPQEAAAQPAAAAQALPPSGDSITDDVIEMSPEIDNTSSPDDDLERALQLSRETMEQMIDESDIAERKSADEPAGLKNVGNTCWFNSIVQTLYTLPYFRRLILNFRYLPLNRSLTDSEQQAISFTEELRHLFVLLLKSPRCSINPDRAIKKFKNTRKLCGLDFSHEDCSEFATHLIDLVELAYETIGKNLIIMENASITNPVNAFVTGEVIVERNEHKSIHEALRQINIQMIDSSNLYDGLETLWLGSADESLSNQQPIAEQRWLTRLPPVLFTCLNRYRFSHTTKQASKIIAPFEFYPELYLDRYMLINKNLILHKRNLARTLYAQLHDLEDTLNSYLKYPCNNESFALANAIRVVYEYSTGCRLNPTIPKRSDSILSDQTASMRARPPATAPIRPSHVSNMDLQFIQNTLPTWLTEIEAKCAQLREEIRRVHNELKQLYDEPSLKQVRYTLHAVCVHEGSATLGHFWTYVYHADKHKWFRYNDNEVVESKWPDVFEAGIGGQRTATDREEPRAPSAYLLVYINAEQKSLSNNVHFDMTTDLQHVLDDDWNLLQQQIEIIRLEQLQQSLKAICERIDKEPLADRVLSTAFFTGSNAACDAELVKPLVEPTTRLLKAYESRILSIDIDHLLQEILDKEIRTYAPRIATITAALPHQDLRIQHILSYFSANRVDLVYRQRVLLDVIRLLPIPNEDVRLRIFKYQAQITCHNMQMSAEETDVYHKLLLEYRDFRSVIAAFLAGCQLMHEEKFEEAVTYFCVACEYNLRLSKSRTTPMKAMDSWLLFKSRRLCFERWNEVVMNRFKSDPEYRLDTMTHQFLPCLMQLKLGSDEDLAYISEIQRAWCLLLDKFEPTERSLCLEEFLQRLLEYPLGQHYHSVSINKHQLVSRYEDAVRELVHRFPSMSTYAVEQPTSWTTRSIRSTSLNTPVSIPVVIHHSQAQHRAAGITVSHPRGASPMQQGGEEQQQPCPPPRPPPPTTPPSTSLPPSSS